MKPLLRKLKLWWIELNNPQAWVVEVTWEKETVLSFVFDIELTLTCYYRESRHLITNRYRLEERPYGKSDWKVIKPSQQLQGLDRNTKLVTYHD